MGFFADCMFHFPDTITSTDSNEYTYTLTEETEYFSFEYKSGGVLQFTKNSNFDADLLSQFNIIMVYLV